MINLMYPKPKKCKWKYKQWYWQERMLSRLRVGVMPTTLWAKSIGQNTDGYCRHCGSCDETLSHLFEMNCPKLHYNMMTQYMNMTFSDMVEELNRNQYGMREQLETALLRFIYENNVFKIVTD